MGVVIALSSPLTRPLPARSAISPVSSMTTVASNGSTADGVNATVVPPLTKRNVPATGTPPTDTLKEVGETVAGSTASVKTTTTGTVVPTPTAPSGGSMLCTFGAVASGDVVRNVEVTVVARAFAARSRAVASIVTVYCVLISSAD